ncbi:MAG: ATP synthase F0 subunit B [Nitrospinota bacterium]|nr:MAG: ATP synthase F0 subunit B [Nitrospinota bacterium]
MLSINWTLLVQLAGFVFLTLFLKKTFFQPLLTLMERREQEIQGRLKEAERLRAQGEKVLRDYEEAISSAKREVLEQLTQAQREGERRQREILTQAQEEATRLAEEAQRELEAAVQQARTKLTEEAKTLAYEIGEKILGRTLSAA